MKAKAVSKIPEWYKSRIKIPVLYPNSKKLNFLPQLKSYNHAQSSKSQLQLLIGLKCFWTNLDPNLPHLIIDY